MDGESNSARLSEQVYRLEKQRDAWQTEAREAHNNRDYWRQRFNELAAVTTRLQDENYTLKTESENVPVNRLHDAQREVLSLRSGVVALKHDIAVFKNEKAIWEEANTSLKRECADVRTELDAANEKINVLAHNAHAYWYKQFEAEEKARIDAMEQLEATKERLDASLAENSQLLVVNREHLNARNTVTAQLDTEKRANASLAARVDRFRRYLDSMRERLAISRKENYKLKARIREMESANRGLFGTGAPVQIAQRLQIVDVPPSARASMGERGPVIRVNTDAVADALKTINEKLRKAGYVLSTDIPDDDDDDEPDF